MNVPVGIFAILWAARVLPAERRGPGQTFDLLGAALSSTTLFALLLALIDGESWGWASPPTLMALAAFVVLGALFLIVERRAAQPMIDLALFRIRAFSAGLASLVIAFSGLFTATFLLPFLLQQGSGFTPLEAGLLLTPIPITTALVAPFSGALSDRIGSRLPASAGLAIMALGLLSLAGLPPGFEVVDLAWRLVLVGLGQGLFMSPNSSAILGSVPRARIGTASGTLAQMRVTGQALGIALSGAFVAIRLPVHEAALAVEGSAAEGQALAMAIQDAFIVAALLCGVGIMTSAMRGGTVRR